MEGRKVHKQLLLNLNQQGFSTDLFNRKLIDVAQMQHNVIQKSVYYNHVMVFKGIHLFFLLQPNTKCVVTKNIYILKSKFSHVQ